MKKNTYLLLFLLLLVYTLGAVGPHPVLKAVSQKFNGPVKSADDYPLLNSEAVQNLQKHYIINFGPLRNDLGNIQKSYPQKSFVYFDYLNNSSWIGLNEKDMFTAASTVKVPLAMALMKAVESGKIKLTDSYTLDSLDLDPSFGDLYKAGADKAFTVEELIKIMLEQSDDTAMMAIFNIFNKLGINDPLGDVYTTMGWTAFIGQPLGSDGKPDYQDINTKTLSNMFTALYNATYVDADSSQKILAYLANTPFNDKIDAGVPDGVTVAHKIGVYADNNTYSDCGIVYAPNRNYILCVGFVGDENSAKTFMSKVSKTAYQYVIDN